MDDDKDFSFCQLNSQVDLDQPGSPKAMPKIHDVIIKDDFLNGAGIDESMANSFASSIKFSPDDASCNVIIPKVGDVQPINDSSDNAGVDGSLSLKVVNMPPPKLKSSGALELSISGRTKDSANGSAAEPKIVKKKPPVRAKVPFEKGYSQMDWLKLTQTHPDLAGLKGNTNRRLISIDEVKQHKNEGSVWTVLKGRVYNITPYMKFHPGGVDMLMKAAGKDCTSLFNKYHAWVNAEFLLEKCLVGALDADR